MPKTNERSRIDETFVREASGWITRRVSQPDMEVSAAELLLKPAKSRTGNLRFAIDGRQVCLLGELREAVDSFSFSELCQRLREDVDVPGEKTADSEIVCVLGETGYEWAQPREDRNQWQAVVGSRLGPRCELTVTIVSGGVEVRAQLADWQADLCKTSKQAVARFLALAQGCVRFARFELHERVATVVSFATADRLDVELPDGLASVRAAHALAQGEVRALVHDMVAERYLEATELEGNALKLA